MRVFLTICIVLMGSFATAQTSYDIEGIQETIFNSDDSESLPQTYDKDRNYAKERSFDGNLKDKYSGRDFNYQELEEKKPKQKEGSAVPKIQSKGVNFFGAAFPAIIIILIIVLIMVAILRKSEFSYFTFRKSGDTDAEKLLSEEDESIDDGDFERLLERALKNNNYRLATRYYYLWLLQRLSRRKYIEYHKDKTNSEYLFELKDQDVRTKFSYLSYVYSYIWYGEFPVDKAKFTAIEKKYQSFMNQIR